MKTLIKKSFLLFATSLLLSGTILGQAGIIFPSFTSEQRDVLKVEAGHTIFNVSSQTVNYFDGKKWVDFNNTEYLKSNSYQDRIQNGSGAHKVAIADAVPFNAINFDISNSRILRLHGHRIEPFNNGNSVFLGKDAGTYDDLSNNQNAFVGNQCGFLNTTGNLNAFLGAQSGYSNTFGFRNVFLGHSS